MNKSDLSVRDCPIRKQLANALFGGGICRAEDRANAPQRITETFAHDEPTDFIHGQRLDTLGPSRPRLHRAATWPRIGLKPPPTGRPDDPKWPAAVCCDTRA